MDKTLIQLRIDSILKHISLVKDDLKDMSLEQFASSDLHVRGTCFSLMQIGEQLTKLESIFKDDYPNIPWKEAIKLRTLIVHVYNKVDAYEIYKIAKNDLDDLETAIKSIKI